MIRCGSPGWCCRRRGGGGRARRGLRGRTSGRGRRGRWRRGRALRGGGSCRCRMVRRRRGSRAGRSTRGSRSDRWVGAGIEETVSSQVSKVLPVGNPAALRRVLIDERCRPASSSASSARTASAGSQRCALAVASTSGACAAHVRQPQLAQQLDDLVDRRGGRRVVAGGGHRRDLARTPCPRRVVGAESVCSRVAPLDSARAGRSECPARGSRRARIEARSPSANRPKRGGVAERPVDPLDAVEPGELDGFGHLHLDPRRARRRRPR